MWRQTTFNQLDSKPILTESRGNSLAAVDGTHAPFEILTVANIAEVAKAGHRGRLGGNGPRNGVVAESGRVLLSRSNSRHGVGDGCSRSVGMVRRTIDLIRFVVVCGPRPKSLLPFCPKLPGHRFHPSYLAADNPTHHLITFAISLSRADISEVHDLIICSDKKRL